VTAPSQDSQTATTSITYTVAATPVSLAFSGSIGRTITGAISAGSLNVTTAKNGTLQGVTGNLTVAATDASTAQVQVAIANVDGWYIGAVTVQDTKDGLSTVAAVLTQKLSVSNGLVTSTATGLSGHKAYNLNFTI
jgi:uncharacterized protein YaiE (UPF0345 family)